MDANQISSFLCESCGGAIEFDIASQEFRCSSCGAKVEVETADDRVKEYDFSQYHVLESQSKLVDHVSVVQCQSCGGEVYFNQDETASICPMCGSNHVKVTGHDTGIPPEGVIPFKVDRYEAQKKFGLWIKKRWFAPNLLKKAYVDGVLTGIYVPFWTYDAYATARYSGKGGYNRTKKNAKGETQSYIEWHYVSGTVADSFDDIQICASRNQTRSMINSILPYNTIGNSVSFTPVYLAGYKAERYSINAAEGFGEARGIIDNRLRDLASSDIYRRGYHHAMVSSLSPTYHQVTYKHLLLPMWTAQYGYRGQSYSYVINGESGKVTGKYPLSYIKIALCISMLVALVLGLMFYDEIKGQMGRAPSPQVAYHQTQSSRWSTEQAAEQAQGEQRLAWIQAAPQMEPASTKAGAATPTAVSSEQAA